MKIIIPVSLVNDATSSNLAGSLHDEWDSVSTYSDGGLVKYTCSDGITREYKWWPPEEETVATTSLNKNPELYSVKNRSDMNPDAKSTDDDYRHYWLDLGPANDHALFANMSGAVSSRADGITVSVTPAALYNSMALLNIDADSVVITVADDEEGEVYRHEADMLDLSNVYDFYTWCFAPILKKTDIVLKDLPTYLGATLQVVASNLGNTAQIGELVAGSLRDTGATLYGTSIGRVSSSIKTTDDSGNTTLDKKTSRKRIDFAVRIETRFLDSLTRLLDGLDAVPAVYMGYYEGNEVTALAFYKDFTVPLGGPTRTDLSIQVEELK